jgi:uncharacterized Ntn-hydrolase superfamily protein
LASRNRRQPFATFSAEERFMTFSIVGLCRRTGQFGCALSTSSMAAGGRAPFVGPGIGVVLSQARSDPRLGVLGMKSLEQGRSAADALAEMLASTPHSAWRQLAVLDRNGGVASFTGDKCTDEKAACHGDGAIGLGNGLASAEVPAAMLRGFQAAPAKGLGERLLMALEYGLDAGGEAYPLRSASMKIAYGGVPFTPVDLRVDFDERPIAELRRLWQLWEPMIDGYVTRCLDPENSPPAAAIEGHLPR